MAGPGQPAKYTDPVKMQADIDIYFDEVCWEDEVTGQDSNGENIIKRVMIRPYTVGGLAYHLEMSRQSILNYTQRDGFFDTIKRAKDRIQTWTEEQLFTTKQVAGVIFNLKNNYGWKDRQDIITNDDADLTPETKEDREALKSIAQEVAKLRVIQGGKD